MIKDNYKKSKSNPYLSRNNRYSSQNESSDFNKKYQSQLFFKKDIETTNTKISNIKKNNEDENEFLDINESLFNSTEGNNTNTNGNIIKIIDENKDEIKDKQNYTKILPNVFRSEEKNFLRKNYSQMELFNNKLSISNNNYNRISKNYNKNEYYNGKKNNDLSKFVAKIKIINFYSTSEIILLIEKIINELNLKKDYSFSVKDSFITFSFNDAEEALSIFKRINIEKLNNKYYQNLSLDIIFEVRDETKENKKEIIEFINDEMKEPKGTIKKLKAKKLLLLPLKKEERNSKFDNSNRNNKKREKFKNFRANNNSKDNVFITNIPDKQFEGIYKKYLEYFQQRKEERRKRELNYINGKDISLLASTPFIENNNRKSFEGHLRQYHGSDVGPSKFNGYIDKASNKRDNYKESHLYEVPDFINHWKLREENKNKWISPAKFHI